MCDTFDKILKERRCFVCCDANVIPQNIAYPAWPCCSIHEKYGYHSYFMWPFIRRELGYDYTLLLSDMIGKGAFKATLKCNVCDSELTEDEISRIDGIKDKNFYCTQHEEAKPCYATEWAKAWFLWKQENNATRPYDEKSSAFMAFQMWFTGMPYEERIKLVFNGQLIYHYIKQ